MGIKNRFKATFIIAVVLLVIGLLTNPSLAQVRKCDGDCGGKYHGRELTKKELKKVLADHAKWVKTVYEPALKAAYEAILKADPKVPGEVSPDNLPQAGRANLCGAKLIFTTLERANLKFANLSGANLWAANLSGADLCSANLSGASLWNADLSNTHLSDTDLSGANLWSANLSDANLTNANLSNAALWSANLSGAELMHANLSNANLMNVNLSDADLAEANVDSVMFVLKPGALPKILSIARARNLSKMRYLMSPHSLLELREAFKKAGLRRLEREITYAIEHTRRQMEWEKGGRIRSEPLGEGPFMQLVLEEGGFLRRVQSVIKWIVFELTSDYGLTPHRPLFIMGGFFIIFWIVYWFALKPQGRAGVWQYWEKDGPIKDKGQDTPVRIGYKKCSLRRVWYAFYFSLLSAFHIGWREFNI
ncbi:MAG: pentapeptide repeat-containing protein, partial [Candidatus Brocadiales bacterium]|nr:pentapeptide repeat-containing protein [Candidatus Brocadiales bacterium]